MAGEPATQLPLAPAAGAEPRPACGAQPSAELSPPQTRGRWWAPPFSSLCQTPTSSQRPVRPGAPSRRAEGWWRASHGLRATVAPARFKS